MAALPDCPPTVTMKSDACAFVPAAGNASTRMTMSCTAPPAQRMAVCLVKPDLALDETADDVMRDGKRRRGRRPDVMPADQHASHLALAKPAGVFKFLLVDDDLAAERLGVAADHQRHRERPG